MLINTSRLLIRPYQITDSTAMFELVNRNKSHLGEYFPTVLSISNSMKSCSSFILEQIESLEGKTKLSCGIFNKETETYIGHIFLKSIDWRIPKGEVGYFIDKSWQGKGLITEALIAFCQYCFNEWNLEKIFLRTSTYNIASQKVAIKAGFSLEGTLKNDFRTAQDRLVDVYYYGKIKNHNPNK